MLSFIGPEFVAQLRNETPQPPRLEKAILEIACATVIVSLVFFLRRWF
jgi:hypothetical protein